LIIAKTSSNGTITAGSIIESPDFIVHIYDGKKITSAASENIDIDLRETIAPTVGKILGGSGGGKPKLTQSGGPNIDRIDEALEKAKQLSILKLRKN
jgi:alanyl-tRNA synthetase